MKKVLSVFLTLTMLICLSVPAMADAAPHSNYIFYIEMDGLTSIGGTGTGSVTRVPSETPSCLLEKPSNLTMEREGQTFLGLFCKANSKTYQFGDTLLLEDFVPYQDGYKIQLQAMYTNPAEQDINYIDVDAYSAELHIAQPTVYDAEAALLNRDFDPTKDTDAGLVDYSYNKRTLIGRIPSYGVSPVGYLSKITGNFFKMGSSFALDKLPAPKFAGTTTREISPTEAERIHSYVITDYLIPIYSFCGATGGFVDPLYDCSILYYVPSPLSNSADLNAPLGTVGTQTVTGITMEELIAPDYTIKLNDAPSYAGYIFNGYSLLTETKITVPDDHLIVPGEMDYINDSPGHIRLSMKLHYSIDPDDTGLQNPVTYAPNNGSLPVTGAAPADQNLYTFGVPFRVMGQGTLAIDGYEFIGWNTKADGSGTMYHENDMAPMTEDGILYAQWKPEGSVLVSMSGNGGSFGSETSKDMYMIPNTAFADAAGYEEPVREGYDFNGWASSPDAAVPDITAVPSTDNTAVYAVWSRKADIIVTFEMNGHGTAPAEQRVMEGDTIIKPDDPTASGWTFDGWYADSAFSAAFDFNTAINADTTIYAKWRYNGGGGGAYIPVTYTLTFNTNGGSAISSVSGTNGKAVELDKYVPTRDGFEFGGWYSDSELTSSVDKTVLNGNKTVYAKWNTKARIAPELPITDVKETDWSYKDIVYVFEKGLMSGTSPVAFSPKTNTSRAMIVTILWRLDGEPVANYAMSFHDVASDQWYTEAIRWAQANGIVNGYSTEKFGVNDPITREQMAAILYRFADFKGYDVCEKADLSRFSDSNKIGEWAIDAAAWANANSLVNGVTGTKIDPQGKATREQVAAILHRFCENIVK